MAADVRDAASRGPEGLERFRDRFLPGRPAFRARGMWELVWLLEARRRELTGEPLAKADDLVAALLAALEVPDEQVRALRAESRPGARQRLLREMR